MIALEFQSAEENKKIINALIEKGIFTDWFLFAPQCLRIVPPLIISAEEIKQACRKITEVLQSI